MERKSVEALPLEVHENIALHVTSVDVESANAHGGDNNDEFDDNSSVATVEGPGSITMNYSAKKTVAQGMMDLALLTANASQLRYIMSSPSSTHRIGAIAFIGVSIVLQIAVGVALIFIGRQDILDKQKRNRLHTTNNCVVALVFIITVLNIFIAAFATNPESTANSIPTSQ